VGSALACGNAVVLKPSEFTPLTGQRLAELVAEATGLEALVAVASGDGSTGAALVQSGVDKIAFTGSTATGRKVMGLAAEHLIPVVLELGGKDAMIVCEDADIERAARGAVWAAFYGCGQICMSVERVYVVAPAYDGFVKAAVAEARRVRTSDEPEAMVGSLIAPFQLERVESHIDDARARGARILLGGRPIKGPGYFYEPTVVVDVDHSMALMREETFGPVLPIMKVASEDEAVRLANDIPYGLDASVWTRSKDRARRIARQLEVGTVVLNDHLINYTIPDLPFGGTRHSGFGRVHGREGLREFVRPKAWVEDRLALPREPYWFEEGGSSESMVRALLDFRHGRGLRDRLAGAWRLLHSVRR
jgi:succinate-semialdehyde dehydrogenase/glutarate-semialdehyde dehydrogenase